MTANVYYKVAFFTNSAGTGSVVWNGNTLEGYRPPTFIPGGTNLNYEIDDFPNWEVGAGVWDGASTFTRSAVVDSSSNGALISLSGNNVFVNILTPVLAVSSVPENEIVATGDIAILTNTLTLSQNDFGGTLHTFAAPSNNVTVTLPNISNPPASGFRFRLLPTTNSTSIGVNSITLTAENTGIALIVPGDTGRLTLPHTFDVAWAIVDLYYDNNFFVQSGIPPYLDAASSANTSGLFANGAWVPNVYAPATIPNIASNISGAVGSSYFAAADGTFAAPISGPQNQFRNPSMSVWQRGQSGGVTGGSVWSYTADGWSCTSTAANCIFTNSGGGPKGSVGTLTITANGATTIGIRQPIEGQIAVVLAGHHATVSASIYNNSSNSFTPTLQIKRAGLQANGDIFTDNYANTITDVSVALQPCPAFTWTSVAYTFAANANSWMGIIAEWDFALTNGQQILFTEADMCLAFGANIGLNNAPPWPELRNYWFDLGFCQRYLQISGPTSGGIGTSNTTASIAYTFPTPMRVTPGMGIFNGVVNGGSLLEINILQHPVTAIPANLTNQFGSRFDVTFTTAATSTQKPCILETGAIYFDAEI